MCCCQYEIRPHASVCNTNSKGTAEKLLLPTVTLAGGEPVASEDF